MNEIFSGSPYDDDPDKKEEVWGEEREDGDLHHNVQLAIHEEGAAGASQVRGEVLQKLDHDQQHRVSYRGACVNCLGKRLSIVILVFCYAFYKM